MKSTDECSVSTNTHAGDAKVLPLWQEQISTVWVTKPLSIGTEEEEMLVQQLPSCLGLKLRTEMVILLKTNNFCTNSVVLGFFGIMTYGKLPCAALGRRPVIHKPLDVFSVCPYS